MPSAIAATPVRSMVNVSLAPERAGDVLGLADEAVLADAHVVEEELAGRRARAGPSCAAACDCVRPGHALVEDEAETILRSFGGVAVVELADEDDGVGVGAVGDEGLASR